MFPRLRPWVALLGLLATVPLAAQQAAPAREAVPAAPIAVTGSKIWLGREAAIEEYLRTAKVVRIKDIPVGVTHPRRCFFDDGGLVGSIVFKHLIPGRASGYRESYKSEIAAYELDKMLGLGMVPPTVERKVGGEIGSAQLWVEHCTLLKERDTSTAPNVVAWNRQVYRQRVWDNLVANIDRNQGNLLVDADWNLILIDHSRAFTTTTTMPFAVRKIDRELYTELKALNEQDINAHLGTLLLDGPKSLLKRRDKLMEQIDGLIKQYGEAAVLIQ